MNAFFTSQFSYCPLVWMYRGRTNNNKMNRLHDRYLRIVYNDKQSSFNELLEKDDSVSIHMRNIQILATKIYYLMNLKPYKIWILLKLKLKTGNQKIARVGYEKFTLIQ